MRANTAATFWMAYALVGRSDECWGWQGTLVQQPSGVYGQMCMGGRLKQAHRVAYEELVGPIPEGMVIHHVCKNTTCINPAHLKALTPSDHNRQLEHDSFPAQNLRKTHCKRGHEFTPENTIIHSHGGRICLECKRMWSRHYRNLKRFGRSDEQVAA